MENKHRKLIEKYCDKMVNDLDIRRIWPRLFGNNGIFTEKEPNISRWEANLDDPVTVKEILMKIQTRGPHAFSKFVNILKRAEYNDLANLLEEKTTSPKAMGFISLRDSRKNNKVVANIDTSYQHQVESSSSADNREKITISLSTTIKDFISVRDNENNIAANNNTNSNNNNSGSSSGDNTDYTPSQLAISGCFNLQEEEKPLKVVVEKTIKFSDHLLDVYPMRSNPHGLVLIITLTDYILQPIRNGSVHDEKNLKDLFEQMGFKTICKSNLTASQIREEIRKFSQNPQLKNVDSCFVIISGHGYRCSKIDESCICGITHDPYEDEQRGRVYWSEIISYFSHVSCEALRNKPKVFIFQSCRGTEDQLLVRDINNDENPQSIYDRNRFHDESELMFDSDNYSDILIAASTIPNFVSYRDGITGSWFITTICDVFMKYANTYHIRKLFIMVDECISRISKKNKYCQTTAVRSINFNRQLYLNPGLFETE